MSKKYEVVYSPAAVDDLENIYVYIAFELEVPQIAKDLIDRIRNAVRSLATLPARHPAMEEEPWQGMGMRRMNVDNFAVFYLVENDANRVAIVRVIYGGRDIQEALSSANK